MYPFSNRLRQNPVRRPAVSSRRFRRGAARPPAAGAGTPPICTRARGAGAAGPAHAIRTIPKSFRVPIHDWNGGFAGEGTAGRFRNRLASRPAGWPAARPDRK